MNRVFSVKCELSGVALILVLAAYIIAVLPIPGWSEWYPLARLLPPLAASLSFVLSGIALVVRPKYHLSINLFTLIFSGIALAAALDEGTIFEFLELLMHAT